MPAILVRQVLGAIAEFDKTRLVAKLAAARRRKREGTGRKVGGPLSRRLCRSLAGDPDRPRDRPAPALQQLRRQDDLNPPRLARPSDRHSSRDHANALLDFHAPPASSATIAAHWEGRDVKTSEEQPAWAKQRALTSVDRGDFTDAVAGLRADLVMSSDQARLGYKAQVGT